MSSTALQVALFYAAIANGGDLLQPRLVKEIVDADGDVVERTSTRVMRGALRAETCGTLSRLLREVVERGTGTLAEIEWLHLELPDAVTSAIRAFLA